MAILLEVVLVGVLIGAGGSLWSCLKASTHLRGMLANPRELKRLIDLVGYDKLYTEAREAKPVFGGYGNNILRWDSAHCRSLSIARLGMLLLVFVVLAASLWMGVWYLAVGLVVFVALRFCPLPAVAKDNNPEHLALIMRNLIKWRQENDAACEEFCYEQCPEYCNLYDLLSVLPSETSDTERGKELRLLDFCEEVNTVIPVSARG